MSKQEGHPTVFHGERKRRVQGWLTTEGARAFAAREAELKKLTKKDRVSEAAVIEFAVRGRTATIAAMKSEK